MTFIFFSCGDSIPSGVISADKMQNVIWDLLRADALASQNSIRDSTKNLALENIILTKKVFLIHNISEAEYNKSYSYYTQHPDKFRVILDSLNAKKSRVDTPLIILIKKPSPIIDTNKSSTR